MVPNTIPSLGSSIPITRSIKLVDAVGFAGFPPQNTPLKCSILYAIGRERMVLAVRDAPSTPILVLPNNTPTIPGCATYKWKLSRRAFLPVVFNLAIQMAAAESQDRFGSSTGQNIPDLLRRKAT